MAIKIELAATCTQGTPIAFKASFGGVGDAAADFKVTAAVDGIQKPFTLKVEGVQLPDKILSVDSSMLCTITDIDLIGGDELVVTLTDVKDAANNTSGTSGII